MVCSGAYQGNRDGAIRLLAPTVHVGCVMWVRVTVQLGSIAGLAGEERTPQGNEETVPQYIVDEALARIEAILFE